METEENNASVSLPIYDWHCLLRELEFSLRIMGRDSETIIRLYEGVASQLSDVPVKVNRPAPNPPQENTAEQPKRKSWIERLFS